MPVQAVYNGDVGVSTQSDEITITNYSISIYKASKTTNELLIYAYSYTYGIKIIGLRFFSVQEPYECPNIAP